VAIGLEDRIVISIVSCYTTCSNALVYASFVYTLYNK